MEVLIDALSTRRQIYSSPSSSVFSYPPSFPFLVRFPGMRETLTPLCLGSSGRGRRTGELRGTSERRPKILPFNELLIVSHDDIKRRSRVQSRSRVSQSVGQSGAFILELGSPAGIFNRPGQRDNGPRVSFAVSTDVSAKPNK